jgi:hypothetical protein
MKSNNEIFLVYFSNIDHRHVINQLTKSKIKTQLVCEETKQRNLVWGRLSQMK